MCHQLDDEAEWVYMTEATHDYTKRGWGHDFFLTSINGKKIIISGWGSGIKKGDYLLIPSGSSSTRYKVKSVRYRSDPPDMWAIEAEFAPRPASQ